MNFSLSLSAWGHVTLDMSVLSIMDVCATNALRRVDLDVCTLLAREKIQSNSILFLAALFIKQYSDKSCNMVLSFILSHST